VLILFQDPSPTLTGVIYDNKGAASISALAAYSEYVKKAHLRMSTH